MKLKRIFIIPIIVLTLSFTLMAQREIYVLNRGDHEVVAYDLENYHNQRTVVESNAGTLTVPYDLEFNVISNQLLWTEVNQGAIYRAIKNTSGSDPVRAEAESAPVDLAVDLTNNHMYWLDHKQKRIFRSDLEGNEVVEIVDEFMNKPSSIAVSPAYNRLFWADMELKKIFVSGLDGQNIEELINIQEGYAVRLLVDEVNKVLYWTDDARHGIYATDLWGRGVHEIYKGYNDEHPFGLYFDHQEGYLYWTDYGTDEVKRIQPFSMQAAEVVIQEAGDPIALFISDKESSLRSQDDESVLKESVALSVAPNPTTDYIIVSLTKAFENEGLLTIYNQVGQGVKTMPLTTQRIRLDVSELTGGWYICEVKHGDKRLYQQFVLSRN